MIALIQRSLRNILKSTVGENLQCEESNLDFSFDNPLLIPYFMLDGNTDLEDMTVTFDGGEFTLGSLYHFDIKEDLTFDVIAKRTFTLSFYYNAILRRLSNKRISDHYKSMLEDEIRSVEPKLNWYLYKYFLNHAYYHSKYYNS